MNPEIDFNPSKDWRTTPGFTGYPYTRAFKDYLIQSMKDLIAHAEKNEFGTWPSDFTVGMIFEDPMLLRAVEPVADTLFAVMNDRGGGFVGIARRRDDPAREFRIISVNPVGRPADVLFYILHEIKHVLDERAGLGMTESAAYRDQYGLTAYRKLPSERRADAWAKKMMEQLGFTRA